MNENIKLIPIKRWTSDKKHGKIKVFCRYNLSSYVVRIMIIIIIKWWSTKKKKKKRESLAFCKLCSLDEIQTKIKENEKRDRSWDLAEELKQRWKTTMMIIKAVIGAFSLVLWHTNHCRLFKAKSIFLHTIQFSIQNRSISNSSV